MTRPPRPRRRPRPVGTVPLARALSKLGLATRSEAAALVTAGRVAVNGRTVTDPRCPVIPEAIAVAIDGRASAPPPRLTIALHKPRGVVTTRRDPEGRPTVYGLIAGAGGGLAPVGRLDLASSGLLLCTNDTRLAAWLTDPASGVEREYVVTVRGRLGPAEAADLQRGRTIDGERLSPERLTVLKASGRETHLRIVLCEGRNREIRRLLASAGHDVTRLLRVRIGGLDLGALAPGAWRVISEEVLADAFADYPVGRPRRPRRAPSAHEGAASAPERALPARPRAPHRGDRA
ncbi:MAG: pseudouridine synthase [Vicinamibacterales bacterium]